MDTKIYQLYGIDTAMHLLRPGAKWEISNSHFTQWEAPTPMPDDGKKYMWDESNLSWKELING